MATLSTRDVAEDGLNAWRNGLLEATGHFSQLAKLDWPKLCEIELFPGSRLGDRIIVVPEKYLPPENMRRISSRQRDPLLGDALVAGVLSDAVASQREESMRRALLVLGLPHDGKRGDQGLGPSSWLTTTGIILRTIKHLFAMAPPSLGNIWQLEKHLPASIPLISRCERTRANINTIFRRLRLGAGRGLIPDLAKIQYPPKLQVNAIEGSHKEKSDNQQTAPQISSRSKSTDEQKHFDDRFVVSIIRRAKWIFENTAEQLIACWLLLEQLENNYPELTDEQLKLRKNRFISDFRWKRDTFQKMPFLIKQRINRQSYEFSDQWPPPNLSSLLLIIGVIQALSFTLDAFCTAARHNEIAGAEHNTASIAKDRMRGVLRKTERAFGGRARDWPLHPLATRALDLQEKLASVIRPEGQSHLWVQLQDHKGSGRGGPMANMRSQWSPQSNTWVSRVFATGVLTLIAGDIHWCGWWPWQ
ncbi:hypothetical protein [Methylobrevis albus]|uniref:Uncharacterized protein n=1 Tax=Methylobrevis albus TaxID=2793297 RepID=A0A931N039_9HYPH|nr:hypothetical protein [Methylobrevis albus]MBH0240022.1 hypothetical protein [Methylobrevis albus]